MTPRIPTPRVRELLPALMDRGDYTSANLADDLLDARQERDALADTLRTERAAREAAEGAIALLSRTLGCESDTPEGIVTEALDYAAEQRERAEAADDAVARAADADARSANLLMCGEAAERAAEEAHAQHAALAGAVREERALAAEYDAAWAAHIAGGAPLDAAEGVLAMCDRLDGVRTVTDALLRGAPGGYVRASVVAEYVRAIDAYEAAGAAFAGRPSAATRAMECEAAADLATKRTALDAALAAVKETR